MKLLPSLKQLEYFDALAEFNHFGKASEALNVTPSTLSAGIRELEAVLGVTLAERTKRKVMITPIGAQIAARAKLLLRDAEDIMELASGFREPMTGAMALGIIPTIGPFLLPRIYPGLTAAYPELQLFIREEQTDALLSKLRAGDLDLAVIALPYDTDGLENQVIFDDGFSFACKSDHPLAARKEIRDRDLADQPLLLLEEGHCLRGHALAACRITTGEFRAEFEATSLHTLVQMVAAGLGVTLLPQLAVEAGITAGTDIELVPLHASAARQIGLVWRSSSPLGKHYAKLGEDIRRILGVDAGKIKQNGPN